MQTPLQSIEPIMCACHSADAQPCIQLACWSYHDVPICDDDLLAIARISPAHAAELDVAIQDIRRRKTKEPDIHIDSYTGDIESAAHFNKFIKLMSKLERTRYHV